MSLSLAALLGGTCAMLLLSICPQGTALSQHQQFHIGLSQVTSTLRPLLSESSDSPCPNKLILKSSGFFFPTGTFFPPLAWPSFFHIKLSLPWKCQLEARQPSRNRSSGMNHLESKEQNRKIYDSSTPWVLRALVVPSSQKGISELKQILKRAQQMVVDTQHN